MYFILPYNTNLETLINKLSMEPTSQCIKVSDMWFVKIYYATYEQITTLRMPKLSYQND